VRRMQVSGTAGLMNQHGPPFIRQLRERRRALAVVLSLARRVVDQAELLSRRAKKAEASSPTSSR
jgi:hypothetical protein